MTLYINFVIVFLIAWFLFSVLNQLNWKLFKVIKHKDQVAMIPSWSFFAPNPGRTDYNMLIRLEKDGKVSAWSPLTSVEGMPLVQGIWNPSKRKHKTITDSVSELKFLQADFNVLSVEFSNAYITLLIIAIADVKREEHEKIQFSIVETYGMNSTAFPNPVIISNWHRL